MAHKQIGDFVNEPTGWDARYQAPDTPPWDLGAPSALVQRLAAEHLSAPARVLVPGCGLGHDVEALARAGFEVTGLDFAPTAVERARARIGPLPGVALVVGDYLDAPEALRERLGGPFDAIVEHTLFCALDPPFLPRYVASTHALLAPRGRLVGAFLNFDGGGPPYGTNADALRELFSEAFAIELLEEAPERFLAAGKPQLAMVARRGPAPVQSASSARDSLKEPPRSA